MSSFRSHPWTLCVALTIMLAGCAGAGSSTNSTLSPVSVDAIGDVAFPRTLQAARMVEVRVSTSGDMDGIVTSAELTTPLFAPVGRQDMNVRITDGWPARLRMQLGEVRCEPEVGDTSVAVTVTSEGGDVAAVVSLPTDVLAGIHRAECDAKVATDAAQPELVAESAVGDDAGNPPRWDTTVRLTRGDSADTATLTGLSGNVIFTLEPREPLPIELAPDQATADVAVRVSATRCDAHAFAESKKTFVFGAWIVVDGVERRIEYAATGDAKAALQELFNRCGENSDSDGIGGQ